MNPATRIAKNTSILTAIKILTPALSLALVLAVSRFLGVEGLGRYTLVFALFTFLTTVTPLGLEGVLMRGGARNSKALPNLLSNGIVLGSAASILTMPVLYGLGNWLGYDAITRVTLTLASLAVLPTTLLILFEAIFVSREHAEYIAGPRLVESVFTTGVGVFFLTLGYGLNAVVLTFVCGRLLACVFGSFLLRRVNVRLRFTVDRAVLRHLASVSPTFLFIGLFAILYWRIDILMLSMLRGLTDVGVYGAAYRIMEAAKLLPQSLCMAMYPQLVSNASLEKTENLQRLGEIALRYLWAITLPLAVLISLLSGPILVFFYGEGFQEAAKTLTVLIWTIIPYSFVRYHAYILFAADRQRIDLMLNILMSGINVTLNLLLIPRYGPLGAALATAASICLYLAAQYAYLHHDLREYLARPPALLKPIVASTVMGISLWSLSEVSLLIQVCLALVVYLCALLCTRFFTANEFKMLRAFIKV